MKRIMSMRDFGLADIGSRIRDTMSKRALNRR
jgi:hypothetical protein